MHTHRLTISLIALLATTYTGNVLTAASAEETPTCTTVKMTTPPIMTVDELTISIEETTKGFRDISFVATVVEKSTKILQKMEPSFSQLYDFKSATINYREPAMLRIEGRLGIIKAEYIINGTTKTFRASAVRIKKVENYPDEPSKLQDALDIGLIVPSIWKNRRLEIVEDADSTANGEIKLRFYYAKGDMIYFIWLDSKNCWLRRFEKRDAQMNIKARVEYSKPINPDGVIWMPSRIELYSPEGEKAGAMEITDMKVNKGLYDSLFK